MTELPIIRAETEALWLRAFTAMLADKVRLMDDQAGDDPEPAEAYLRLSAAIESTRKALAEAKTIIDGLAIGMAGNAKSFDIPEVGLVEIKTDSGRRYTAEQKNDYLRTVLLRILDDRDVMVDEDGCTRPPWELGDRIFVALCESVSLGNPKVGGARRWGIDIDEYCSKEPVKKVRLP